MTFDQNHADGEPGADSSARALESVVQRASRRQRRFARITAGSSLVAVAALALAAAVLLNRAPVRAATAANSGPGPLIGSQSPGEAGPGTGGYITPGTGPGNTGGVAQGAYFTRTTPSGVKISASPLFAPYPVPSCQDGGSVQGGVGGSVGSAPAATGTIVPDSGTTQTITSPPGSTTLAGSSQSVPSATTPLETLPPSGTGSIPKCELATTSALNQLKITVSYGSFAGTFLSSAGLAGGSWIEQAYTLPDGSRLVAVSVSLPPGTPTAALLSQQGTVLDGPAGPTTGYAAPYSDSGWAILATLFPPSQNSNAAPALSLQLQPGTSASFHLSLPALPAPLATGADATSVSGSWQATQSGTTAPTPQG